jgi:hypothetical protein
MHPLFRLFLAIISFVVPVQAIRRTVGPQDDHRFVNASRICHGDDPSVFEFRNCSILINCVYENFSESFKAGLSSATSIAALLPTILALIGKPSHSSCQPLSLLRHCAKATCIILPSLIFLGSPPLELVQLALISPHRALATCCFTIGLPSGLFRQLRPLHTQLSQPNPREPRMREWTIPLPSISERKWHNITVKLCMDILIMSLASIMLWRNWVVSSFTMVSWRCDYSWLLFAWYVQTISHLYKVGQINNQ